MLVPALHQPFLDEIISASSSNMPSGIFCSTVIDNTFGVNTTNPAVTFNVTSSSTSAFAPASVGLTAEQELSISEFPPFAWSSSSSTGTCCSDASGTPSEDIGPQFTLEFSLDDGLEY